jgi:UDP-N-acetylmuramate dehydrogenase
MEFQEAYKLRKHNTLGLEVAAHRFANIDSLSDLLCAHCYAKAHGRDLLGLGGGSNTGFTKNFPGLVIHLRMTGREVVQRSSKHSWLRVSAGHDWNRLVEYTLKNKLYGLENLVGIPGHCGAAPIQNIGAYGVEIASRLASVSALDRKTERWAHLTADQCQFGYRDSIFKNDSKDRYIISAITLKLDHTAKPTTTYLALQKALEGKKEPEITPQLVAKTVKQLRDNKLPDPDQVGNVGSFFKNPTLHADEFQKIKELHPNIPAYPQKDGRIKLAAAYLIEACGYKGHQQGCVGVWSRQSLVLVNLGGARGDQILELALSIQRAVRKAFHVELEIEPRIY